MVLHGYTLGLHRVILPDRASNPIPLERAAAIGFGRCIVRATTLFIPDDLRDLRVAAPLVVRRRVPEYDAEYARRGWKLPSSRIRWR